MCSLCCRAVTFLAILGSKTYVLKSDKQFTSKFLSDDFSEVVFHVSLPLYCAVRISLPLPQLLDQLIYKLIRYRLLSQTTSEPVKHVLEVCTFPPKEGKVVQILIVEFDNCPFPILSFLVFRPAGQLLWRQCSGEHKKKKVSHS